MKDETNDLSPDGIEDVAPSDDDDFSEFLKDDPVTDDVDEEASEETDDETDEVEADDEAEDQETDDEPETDDLSDDVMVKMADGTQVSLKDLKDSPMLKADHTRKTQEVAEKRKTVDATAQKLQGISEALTDYLVQMMPPEPDVNLAMTDPNKWTAQKAQYEAASQKIQQLIALGSQPKDATANLSEKDQAEYRANEAENLASMFPEVKDPAKRKAFIGNAREAAIAVGFNENELDAVDDSKMIALAHWAKIGMSAHEARAKAKAKVKETQPPPVTPRKRGEGGAPKSGNAAAMRRLQSDDSIENAVAALLSQSS